MAEAAQYPGLGLQGAPVRPLAILSGAVQLAEASVLRFTLLCLRPLDPKPSPGLPLLWDQSV